METQYKTDIIRVVFNINGDILGVASTKEKAVEIYEQRYDFVDESFDMSAYYSLLSQGRIKEYELNKFYYE